MKYTVLNIDCEEHIEIPDDITVIGVDYTWKYCDRINMVYFTKFSALAEFINFNESRYGIPMCSNALITDANKEGRFNVIRNLIRVQKLHFHDHVGTTYDILKKIMRNYEYVKTCDHTPAPSDKHVHLPGKSENGALVSVVVTHYNRSEKIKRCIASLIIQTYANLEILIVDDCSDESHLSKLASYIKSLGDDRISLYSMSKNCGTYVAKNEMIKIANGEYITMQDSDDTSDPERIAEQVKRMSDKNVMMCSVGTYRENTREEYKYCLAAVMYRRNVFEDVGFFESIRCGADSDHNARSRAYYGPSSVVTIPKYMYHAGFSDDCITYKIPSNSVAPNDYYAACLSYISANDHDKSKLYLPYPQPKYRFRMHDEMLTDASGMECVKIYPVAEPLTCVITTDSKSTPFEPVRKMIVSKYSKMKEYDECLVLLGYNIECDIAKYRKEYPRKKIIIYQLEQLSDNMSQWYNLKSGNAEVVRRTKHIRKALSECDEIWDYDCDNVMFLKKEGFSKVKHVPLFYCEELRHENKNKKPKYDILFFGSINDRRAALLELISNKYKIIIFAPDSDCGRYANYSFGKHMRKSVFGDELLDYIFDTKMVLNIHYYETFLQEQVRLFELIINDVPVLSEKSRRNYFGELIVEFEDASDMLDKIDSMLNGKCGLDRIGEKFKTSNYKRFKVGVAYNTFYGLDLIEKSIRSIRSIADYVVLVHQPIGFNGQYEPAMNPAIIQSLLERKLIDDIYYYNNVSSDSTAGVLDKRNIGLDMCRKNKCDFIIPMDADECYDESEMLDELNHMYDNDIDTLYSPIYSYYHDEKHYFEDTYFVASG